MESVILIKTLNMPNMTVIDVKKCIYTVKRRRMQLFFL